MGEFISAEKGEFISALWNTDRIPIEYRSNIDDTLQAAYWEIYTNALLQQRNF
jgi:hypothetical protein